MLSPQKNGRLFYRPEVPAVLSLRPTIILEISAATSHQTQNLQIAAATTYTERFFF